MKIDLTCPVELWQYAMPTEEDAECTFILNNLSDKVVVSVQVTLNCFDENDDLLFRQTERIQGLKAGVGDRFSIVILPAQWDAVEGVDLVIEKVWFDDSTIWRKGNAPLAYYTPNAIAPSRALDDLRFVAGNDAVGYPQVQDQVWVCVCGRANHMETQRCCRCERRRDAVFASFNPENVKHIIAAHEEKLAQAARKAREENNILQENQEKQRVAKRRRRKQLIRLGVSAVIIAVAATVIVVWGIPFARYKSAQDLLTDGQYDQAAAVFAEMGDYRDAQLQLLECDYQKAQSLLGAGDESSLAEAESIFRSLDDYQESAELAKQASYALAGVYRESGRYEAAAEKYQALGSYQDSADQLKETTYLQASDLLNEGNCQVARILFGSLGSYRDAADKMTACSYELAQSLLEQGENQAALDELLTLGAYEDAPNLAKQAYYALAEAAMAEGSFEAAGTRYLLAQDYSDARDKANDCLYQLAQETRVNGDYEKAMQLFLRIPDYLDSQNQAYGCIYDQATQLMENESYAEASALLETIPYYDDAQTKLDDCRYRMAEAAVDSGDYVLAETLLDAIVDYRGSETELKKVRYQLAETDYENGLYEQALTRYEQLDNYRNSATRIRQCKYAMAESALEQQRYETAIDLFSQLGSYKESKANLEEAQYQHALLLKAGGNTDGAVEVLSGMENSKRAEEMLASITMESADALAKSGDYAAASELYATLKSTEARAGYNACRYALAEQLYQQGDMAGAAAAFYQLRGYQDATERSEACYDAYYGQVAQQARELTAQQDYAGVIQTLQSFDLNSLSKTYDDLMDLYNEACYQYAEQLYRSGRPYDAIPFYQAIGDYRDAAKDKLNRRVYLILGEWESATGKTAVFRMDGTCDLMGESLYYRVSNFSLYTGTDPKEMTITHKVSTIDEKSMGLREVGSGQDVLYKFSRVGEFALPQMEMTFETPEASVQEETAGLAVEEAQSEEPNESPEPPAEEEDASKS